MNFKKIISVFAGIVILTAPLIATAAQTEFEDPLGGNLKFTDLLENILTFFLVLTGYIALLGIVYGAVMIILGGMRGEQDLKRGKEIIFWALIGLLIVGAAAVILKIVRTWLGV